MVVSRLASAQAGLGHEVHLLYYGVADQPGTPGASVEMDITKLPSGSTVTCHRLAPPDRGEWISARAARTAIRSIAGNTDIVHLHGIWEPVIKAGASICRKLGVPYVVAPHGMLDEWALAGKKWKKRIALALGYRTMVLKAAMLHAISPYEEECLRRFGFRGPIGVIPNGVYMEEIDPLPPPGTWAKERPEFAGKRWITFLSRLHPVKGLDILGRAFAELAPRYPDVDLVVVGPDFGAKAGFEALVHEFGIADRVHMIGPLWGRERFKPLVDCACFCLPSEHESFGIAIAEAMACRAPVAISEQCHLLPKSELESLGVGRVFKREPSAVRDAIEWILADPERAAAMGACGRRLVEDRFTWQRVAAASIECYARSGQKQGAC
ncbi:MAG: glycosyltransferase [Phycisphaeraceae bacterium]|nr:glycosyltransferase [Phycisphaeraceae bacterium]